MDPDTHVPPTPEAEMQPEPMLQTQPVEPASPSLPETVPQPIAEPATMHDPSVQQAIAAPQPIYTPMAVSQMPKGKSKKKLAIIAGIIIALIVILGGVLIILASKTALIGPLSLDSYEGLNYKRPTSWIKDSSETNAIGYHPKTSLGNGSDNKPTYALKMNVSAQKNVFHSTPNDLKPADKSALQTVIDKEVNNAATTLLPAKSQVGCDTDPTYKDKPKKVTLPGSFLAVKYSFTCKSGSGSSETTFNYIVLDVVPNDKDIEYILNIGAASKQIYDSNLTKINNIINSISF